MSLANPTKTNYGNVDDITPAEMNDIGTNLISLGQKIQKVVDDTWITTNADWNGTAWDRIDIAKAATALQIGIDGSKTAWHVVAGVNPIVWVQGEKWDASGRLVSGVVPLARMSNVILDSFTALNPGTTGILMQAASNSHRFYVLSIRASDGRRWHEGTSVSSLEAVDDALHSSLVRGSSGALDFLALVNGETTPATAVYKVYELTEV